MRAFRWGSLAAFCLSLLAWAIIFLFEIDPTPELWAQTGTRPVVASNSGIFISVESGIQTPSFEIAAGSSESSLFLAEIEIHIDATSRYIISATSSFAGSETSAPPESVLAEGQSVAGACQMGIDGTGFVDGDPGPTLNDQNSTVGTEGRDHAVGLEVNLAAYEELAVGIYVCDVQVLISDSQGNSVPIGGRVEILVVD